MNTKPNGIEGGSFFVDQDFRQITEVSSIALQEDGGNAVTLKIIDKDEKRGPLVRAYDASGIETTATIDVTVKGILNG